MRGGRVSQFLSISCEKLAVHFCYVRSLLIPLEVYQVLAGTANFSLLMQRKCETRPPRISIP